MRIAFTHNLQTSDAVAEAEADRPETVEAILAALRRLGHEVEALEVSGPVSRVIARLEAIAPDLVVNGARGRSGRSREAFVPALCERLGIPLAGADAYTCTLARDKHLTKLLAQAQGVATPRWMFVQDVRELAGLSLSFPVIVKPCFEGASKGVEPSSVVEEKSALSARVAAALADYPEGVLVEEYVPGRDVVVSFLERGPKGGVLPAVERVWDEALRAERRHFIHDFAATKLDPDRVKLVAPAELSADLQEEIGLISRKMARALGLRDVARIDLRLGDRGLLQLLEVDATPSFDARGALLAAARAAGLGGEGGALDGVLEAIVKSAAERHGLTAAALKAKAKKKGLTVGLTFNLKRVASSPGGEVDSDAEYDSPKVIAAIRTAIESFGHDVVELEATPELPAIIGSSGVDVVFNLAEGIRGRNREAQVPAILELLDIPYSGSDAATMCLSLDKALAKRVVAQAGYLTAPFVLMTTGKEKLPKDFKFPAIVKPVAEGSSKGVLKTSVVEDEDELRELARAIAGRYKQGALVETYLPGREFTVAMLGEKRPRVLPPMEIVFINPEAKRPVYAFDHKLDWSTELRYDRPAQVDAALGKELERVARGAFDALGCRDVARVDLRLDDEGRVNFIEVNPLPGLSPGWSDLCLIAESAGLDYNALIGEILAPAIRRFREKKRSEEAAAARSPAR